MRATCVLRACTKHTPRALGLRPSISSGVMTLTGPGLHRVHRLGWDWVTDHGRPPAHTGHSWDRAADGGGGVGMERGGGGIMSVFPPSVPLSATGAINRRRRGERVQERGTCDSRGGGDNVQLLSSSRGKLLLALLTIHHSNVPRWQSRV